MIICFALSFEIFIQGLLNVAEKSRSSADFKKIFILNPKGTVDVISSAPKFTKWHVRFEMVPFCPMKNERPIP